MRHPLITAAARDLAITRATDGLVEEVTSMNKHRDERTKDLVRIAAGQTYVLGFQDGFTAGAQAQAETDRPHAQ